MGFWRPERESLTGQAVSLPQVDWDNPQTYGLRRFYVPFSAGLFDAATGLLVPRAETLGANARLRPGSHGFGVTNVVTTSNAGATLPAFDSTLGDNRPFILAIDWISGEPGTTGHYLWSQSSGGLNRAIDDRFGRLRLVNPNVAVLHQTDIFIGARERHTTVLALDRGGNIEIWDNGTLRKVAADSTVVRWNGNILLGSYGGTGGLDGIILGAAFWWQPVPVRLDAVDLRRLSMQGGLWSLLI